MLKIDWFNRYLFIFLYLYILLDWSLSTKSGEKHIGEIKYGEIVELVFNLEYVLF